MHKKRSLFTAPQVRTEPFRKSLGQRIGGVVWKALKKTCMTLGAVVIIAYVGMAIFFVFVSSQGAPVKLPSEMVLYYRIDGGITETNVKPSLMDPFPMKEVTMPQFVRTLDVVERDDRVKGIVVSLHGQPLSITHIQEFRRAIKDIQDAGKFAYIIAPSYGGGGGIGEYYLASVFDRIWMHPVGIISLPGISMETPYVKSVLDKLGITPQFFQRKEFKSAFESFTSDKMSDSNREAMQAVVNSLGHQITTAIVQGRGFETSEVDAFMRDVLITAQEGVDKKLIDALGYGGDVISYIEDTHDLEGVEIVSLGRYVGYAMGKHQGIEDVAYIRIAGTLKLSPNSYGGSYDDEDLLTSGSEIAAAIQDAARQADIRAIVLRVDSPGGTPAAAEVIRNAVLNAQEAGKLVYISMASVAASGGYWLSADADKIFALPGTLTGSIGVVGGKITIQELAKKHDIRFETIRYGANAGFWSMTEPFNKGQIKRFEAMLDVTYENFISLVANGRGMTFEEAEERAKGRVWTGVRALDLDLIDGLGGLGITLDVLALDLGYEDQSDLSLVTFPRPKATYLEVLEFIEQQAVFMGVMTKIAPMLENFSVYLNMPEAGVNVHSGLSGV
ncbi:MAG: S49 family peptidase [Alphaproteobacteria bacterium]|nr:S49 family peptidase [Alphaproteobacteria bacterium]